MVAARSPSIKLSSELIRRHVTMQNKMLHTSVRAVAEPEPGNPAPKLADRNLSITEKDERCKLPLLVLQLQRKQFFYLSLSLVSG